MRMATAGFKRGLAAALLVAGPHLAAGQGTQIPASPPSAKAPNLKPKVYKMKPPTKAQIDTSTEAAKKRGVGLAGVHLDVEPKALDKGKWQKLPDGRSVWMMRVESPGAAGMRLHFQKFDAGTGQVWIHNGKQVGGPYSGKGPNGDGDFWADAVDAAWVTVEYAPAAAAKSEGATKNGKPPFVLDKVAYQLTK